MVRQFGHRIILGVLAGVLLVGAGFSGVQAQRSMADGAAMIAQNTQETKAEPSPYQMNPAVAARHIHDQFGVAEEEVRAALLEHRDFRDIGQAAMLAKISGRSFSEVLSFKTDKNTWRDVSTQMGVTREQVHAQMLHMLAQRISQCGDVDAVTAEKLLDAGYCGYDIVMAGKLAQASGQDIQSLLDRKQINNRWEDVAEAVGLDRSVGAFSQCEADRHISPEMMMPGAYEEEEDFAPDHPQRP